MLRFLMLIFLTGGVLTAAVEPRRAAPLPLSEAANTGFADEEARDRRGAGSTTARCRICAASGPDG